MLQPEQLHPRFSRNLNTGGDNYHDVANRPAVQTVYHDLDRASSVVLRVEDQAR
jgi:hypothetical protein